MTYANVRAIGCAMARITRTRSTPSTGRSRKPNGRDGEAEASPRMIDARITRILSAAAWQGVTLFLDDQRGFSRQSGTIAS
jgi:hypothetical protein